jgi:Putative addiction module component
LKKIKLFEFFWQELTADEEKFESPLWHESELQQTEIRYSEGKKEVIDWQVAKNQLRNMFGLPPN